MINPSSPMPGMPPTPPNPGIGGGFNQQVKAPAPIKVKEPTKPKKGGIKLGLIAEIQAVYAREEQKQMQLKSLSQGMALKPGWGGEGQ
jgi:hypothetical protein